VGQIAAGSFHSLEDAVVVTQDGHLTARIQTEDMQITFTSGTEDQVGPEQFIRDSGIGVLDPKQSSRQDIYRQLLGETYRPAGPLLLVWAQGALPELEVPDEALHLGESLLALPIRYKPSEPDVSVFVPSVLLKMTPYMADEDYRATIYNIHTHEWVQQQTDAAFLMNYELPQPLADMQIEGATLRIHLRAPGRTYEVLRYRNGEAEVVASGENASGHVTFELTGQNAPVIKDGGVVVGLRIGTIPNSGRPRVWSVEGMQLEVTGTAAE